MIDLITNAAYYWQKKYDYFGSLLIFLIVGTLLSIALYSLLDLYFTLVVRRYRNLIRKEIKV
jgi:hypothetical protein